MSKQAWLERRFCDQCPDVLDVQMHVHAPEAPGEGHVTAAVGYDAAGHEFHCPGVSVALLFDCRPTPPRAVRGSWRCRHRLFPRWWG